MRIVDQLCSDQKECLEGTEKSREADLLAIASQFLWSGLDREKTE